MSTNRFLQGDYERDPVPHYDNEPGRQRRLRKANRKAAILSRMRHCPCGAAYTLSTAMAEELFCSLSCEERSLNHAGPGVRHARVARRR